MIRMFAKRPHRIGVFTTKKPIILSRFATNARESCKLALYLLLSVTYSYVRKKRYLVFDTLLYLRNKLPDIFHTHERARVIYSKIHIIVIKI